MIDLQKLPVLMPHQLEPFNGDHFIQAEFLRLKERHGITTAVEYGTCYGSTALWLADNFDELHTVEINTEFARVARERLEGKKNVKLYVGDSLRMQYQILPLLNNDTIFFIDSHWGASVPMPGELSAIGLSGLKPVIAIHDFFVPGMPDLGYDSYNGQPFTFEWIKPYLDRIYGLKGYDYHYNSQATEIKRGIIYIYPNT